MHRTHRSLAPVFYRLLMFLNIHTHAAKRAVERYLCPIYQQPFNFLSFSASFASGSPTHLPPPHLFTKISKIFSFRFISAGDKVPTSSHRFNNPRPIFQSFRTFPTSSSSPFPQPKITQSWPSSPLPRFLLLPSFLPLDVLFVQVSLPESRSIRIHPTPPTSV